LLAIYSERRFRQSFSERQLYVSALGRVGGEIALVGGISEEQVVKELEDLLKNRSSVAPECLESREAFCVIPDR
jgi:RNA polymerase-interacting CarD/CdnL/TRCF family regulator